MADAHNSVPNSLKIIRFGLRTIGTVSPNLAGYIVFQLFQTPLKRMKLTPEFNPRIFTFIHKKRTLTGYEIQGAGAKVLLVHGWESSAGRFKKLLRLLVEQDYHVFAMDAPAHGASTGRQTNPVDYSEALGAFTQVIGDVDVVIAHSMGAAATMNMLDRFPDFHTEKVVLIGAVDHPQQAVTFFSEIFDLRAETSAHMARHLTQFIGDSMDSVSSAYIAKSRYENALIIHDREDKIVPIEAGRGIAENWKNSRYIETQGLGHRRILNDNAVLEQVFDFMKETEVEQIPVLA